MPVTDPVKTIEDRLWAILLASADFTTTVKVGNRVSMVDPTRQKTPEAKPRARQAADFPEVKIDRGRSRYNPFNVAPTFGTFQGSPCARIRSRVQDFNITITTDDRGSIAAGNLQSLVESLIEDAGPQLGIAGATLVQEITAEHRLTNRDEAAGTLRRVVAVTVSILIRSAA
jgi:hypothetical protein